MPFRVHARMISAIRSNAERVPKEQRERMDIHAAARAQRVEARKAVCLTCRFFLQELERCMHPNCGCPRAVARRHPWASMHRCPEKLWPQ